jgi:hypothetical protein
VPCRRNFWILFPQFYGPFRIALQGDPSAVPRQVEQGKHLPGNFKDQGRIIEGKLSVTPGLPRQYSLIYSMFTV